MEAKNTFEDLETWNWVSGMGGWGTSYMRHAAFRVATNHMFDYDFILSEKIHQYISPPES